MSVKNMNFKTCFTLHHFDCFNKQKVLSFLFFCFFYDVNNGLSVEKLVFYYFRYTCIREVRAKKNFVFHFRILSIIANNKLL